MTDFKALYDRDPSALFKLEDVHFLVEEVNQRIKERNALIKKLRRYLEKAEASMKGYVDMSRRDVQFLIGDMVYLKLKPSQLRSLVKTVNEKLSPRFYRPFKVLKRERKVTYKMELPLRLRFTLFFIFHSLRKLSNLQTRCKLYLLTLLRS